MGRRGGTRDLLTHARRLRRDQTEAERKLWSALRGKRLGGWKFKRQEQIGDFIVDFACFGARLIVEADGSQHAESESDRRRDAWLARQGFRALRFWNNEILENLDGVLRAISEALAAAPSPTSARQQAVKPSYPLPQGERTKAQLGEGE